MTWDCMARAIKYKSPTPSGPGFLPINGKAVISQGMADGNAAEAAESAGYPFGQSTECALNLPRFLVASGAAARPAAHGAPDKERPSPRNIRAAPSGRSQVLWDPCRTTSR